MQAHLLQSFSSRCLAAVLALGLTATSPRLVQASPLASKPTRVAGTVLELDSDDKVLAARFGQSLRGAFAKRGLADGRRDSLVELRLAMGCKTDEPECLARGGRALGVDRMIFGTLRTSEGGRTLALSALAVDTATIESSVRVELADSELGEAAIDRTAERIVGELLGETVVPEAVAPPPRTPPATATPLASADVAEPFAAPTARASTTAHADTGESKHRFGLERPTPAWKWAGFGASAGTLVVSSAAAIGLAVSMVRLRDELVAAANGSLLDVFPSGSPNAGQPNTLNDVDPTREPDICAAAREHPPEDTANPSSVRNKKMTEICNRADAVEKGQYAAYAMVGVSLAATLVFTGLLLIHRKHPRTNARAHHRVQPSLGASTTGVGASLSGRF